MSSRLILVTGATGFIGAHVVDELLRRGHRVRATTRSRAKGDQMITDRLKYAGKLEFIATGNLTDPGVFNEAIKGVDGVIHCSSPVALESGGIENEKDLILPAIAGVESILQAASQEPSVKRIVITSSFAAVVDISRGLSPGFTYTGQDWNPITYEEAKNGSTILGYRGSKKYAELAAWDYIRDKKPGFDLVTITPPMVFGPVVHPVAKVADLNDSSSYIWKVADGQDYPEQRVFLWVDVRDLAVAHVEALLRPAASNRRFLVASPEKFSYPGIGDIIRQEFDWAKDVVKKGGDGAAIPDSFDVEKTAGEEFGITYRSLKEAIVDSVKVFKDIHARESA